MANTDKTRQLSIEQANAIEHLLQGKSDAATAKAVNVSRQTVWAWRNDDVLFQAELNRQRSEMWQEARERLKSLANRALDVVELQLDSGDPKAALGAAKYILQGTRLLGDTDLPKEGPTTPEGVLMAELRTDARRELAATEGPTKFGFDPFRAEREEELSARVETLAESRLKKAMTEAELA
ncbi:MAG: helix-turn-helix domain containing protein [Dehalococcoidales bacterium]|nr:helix-turn-helix domain containing protein [Dehalococcoidales bacterium]